MISKSFRDEVVVNLMLSSIPLSFFIVASSWDEAKEMARPIFTLVAVMFVLSFLPKDPQMEEFIKNGTRRYQHQMYQNRSFHQNNIFSSIPNSGHLFGADFINVNVNRLNAENNVRPENPPSHQQNQPLQNMRRRQVDRNMPH